MKDRNLLSKVRLLLLVVLAVFLVTGTACSDEGSTDNSSDQETDVGEKVDVEEEEETFALEGLWETTYNLTEQITQTHWDTMKIIEFDNAERWVITQNASNIDLGADKYNKILWTPLNRGTTYYCMIEIGRNLLEQVKESTAKADATDPEKGGCPEGTVQTWTRLTKL